MRPANVHLPQHKTTQGKLDASQKRGAETVFILLIPVSLFREWSNPLRAGVLRSWISVEQLNVFAAFRTEVEVVLQLRAAVRTEFTLESS